MQKGRMIRFYKRGIILFGSKLIRNRPRMSKVKWIFLLQWTGLCPRKNEFPFYVDRTMSKKKRGASTRLTRPRATHSLFFYNYALSKSPQIEPLWPTWPKILGITKVHKLSYISNRTSGTHFGRFLESGF